MGWGVQTLEFGLVEWTIVDWTTGLTFEDLVGPQISILR